MSMGVQIIESSNVNSIPIEEELFMNQMDIKNLLEYKIRIKLKDRTGESTFVLFNDVVEKLFDTSAQKLFNKLSSDNNDVPVQIERLCGKDFVFKIKLNTYNLKEGLENFTVSKVWIPDNKLELEYMQREEKKDESIPKTHGTKELSKEKISADVLLENLEDPKEVHVIDGAKSRKRRNLIIDEDEISDEDTN
ncbi:hypothetical protein HAX54_020126, partial [Datura stramonium]|nr:hypothetical protein [Datura stramonium]